MPQHQNPPADDIYPRRAAPPLPAALLSAGRRQEPDQGTQGRAADGPDQSFAVPGEPVPATAGGGGLRADAGVAGAGAANAVRAGASEAVAAVLVEGGVQVTVRRIVVHLPLGTPGQAEWRQMAADFNLEPT